jgi:hypothetical protein
MPKVDLTMCSKQNGEIAGSQCTSFQPSQTREALLQAILEHRNRGPRSRDERSNPTRY